MIALTRRPSPTRVVFTAVPLAGMFVGSVLIHTTHQIHWLAPVAVAVGTVAIAANLAFQFLVLHFLIRVMRRRGVPLLEGVEPMTILALLAGGTAVSAGVVLAMVRLRPELSSFATELFPGLTLLIAMGAALALAPARRLAARRALVLVFGTQFILTLALRLL
jgi:hypothetical protein